MSEVMSEVRSPSTVGETNTPTRALPDPTDRPIPIWPEGVLVAAAGITLAVICFRHRSWLQRKVAEGQRVVEEFQRHGGMEDLSQMAKQATGLFKGS